jgi:uncharacterized iron-regulated protein
VRTMHVFRSRTIVRFLATSALLFSVLAITWPVEAFEGNRGHDASKCNTAGIWLDPSSGERLQTQGLMKRLAESDIVLLGETHTMLEHHRWQLHTLAALSAVAPDLVVGFEMFPRSVQPALDDWSKGALPEAPFLEASRWQDVWGYDPDFYLPLFHFVRQNRLPMVGLNVERSLVSRVGRDGWAAIPQEQREGLTDPAPASEAYRRNLAEVYLSKLQAVTEEGSPHGVEEPASANEPGQDLSTIMESEAFERFVEAQLTWDRAMAEALLAARAEHPEALVVGVLGRGHIEYGHGVPHQLADLGENDVAILLPEETGEGCEALEADVADAVFLLERPQIGNTAPDKPRLGVIINDTEDGVEITEVIDGSVAAAAELAVGDIVRSAAGEAITRNEELVEIVQRQSPGTWLPLEVERDGERLEFIAKFPSQSE